MTTRIYIEIYKKSSLGEEKIGVLSPEGTIIKIQGSNRIEIGRIDPKNHLFRKTKHGEQEVGWVSDNGTIHSHGLFEGGELGWVEPDGVVIQAGLILGEEEVGRVAAPNLQSAECATPPSDNISPNIAGAAAALLLIFLPDDADENRRMKQR